MKAKVDQDTCTGCGLCVDTCPDVFEMDDTTAKVKVAEVPPEAEASCRETVDNCPSSAILLAD